MSDILESDNRAFLIFVPPNGSDKTVESCVRLGAGPVASNMSSQDENTTYNDAVAGSQPLSDLSGSTYLPTSGIALLTPGTINMVAAKGVNTTSGSFTNSVSGPSYTITQDSGNKHIVSAAYTSNDLGTWATLSFNQAATVSVNTVPLQASLAIAPSYAVTGPLTLSNNWGLSWSSSIGFSVNATLARVTNIGWRTIVSNDWDGSNNQYYTAEQAASTAQGFKWTVPVKGLYQTFDDRQKVLCEVINALAVVVDALAVVYSAVGAGLANNASPQAVQSWLKASEPIAIACTAANGILAALGVLFSYIWVDEQASASNPVNWGATAIQIGDGTIELITSTLPVHDPPLDPAEPPGDPTNPNLKLDRENGKVTLTNGYGASIILDHNSIKIQAAQVEISGFNVKITQSTATPPPPPPGPGAGDLAPGAIPGPHGPTVV